jgi:uncharacterized membrane protein
MILNTTTPVVGEPVSSLQLIANAGYPITTSGRETLVSVRLTNEAQVAAWGEIVHLRHHPGRQLSVFADTTEDILEVLAYEFNVWEVKESIRSLKRTSATKSTQK